MMTTRRGLAVLGVLVGLVGTGCVAEVPPDDGTVDVGAEALDAITAGEDPATTTAAPALAATSTTPTSAGRSRCYADCATAKRACDTRNATTIAEHSNGLLEPCRLRLASCRGACDGAHP
jgi:hypothetical protein